MASPGRNDPCPCGSGRKFKHCCLQALGEEDAARVRLRGAEGRVVPALFAYALGTFGEDFFVEAWEEFFLWEEVPDRAEDSREFGTTFDPFFVFSFVPEPGEVPAGWPADPVGLDFLRQMGDSCPALDREFIEQACKSPASFCAVESVTPGRTIDLKDILTGNRFHVLELSASRTLRVGDITYTRIVTLGTTSIMIGASPWVIPPSWHLPIIDVRDNIRPRRLMTRAEVIECEIDVRDLYLEIMEAIEHPPLPSLQNTDGDPIQPTTLTYELGVTPAEAFERLRPLATLRGETHLEEETRHEAGAITAATLTWIKAGNRQHKEWDNTTLGTLRIDGSTLVIDVNSARRGDRIAKEIAKRLGPAATLVDTKVIDINEEIETRRARRDAGGPGRSQLPEPERTPEMEAIEAELMQRHWDAWIDTKVPALGNRTPRQAARTARGRERLEALLTDFASERRSPSESGPDVAELRRRLGLG